MTLNARSSKLKSGGNFKRPDPLDSGTYPCRTVQILDLGLQPQRPFQGQEKPPAHEVMFTYEFLDEFLLDEEGNEIEDKPRWLSETMPIRSLDSDKAKSTQRYYALDPKESFKGDFGKLVDIPCMVTIAQNKGKRNGEEVIYENISNVSAMRPKEAKKAKELVNPPKVFTLDDPDLEIFFSLPEWLQNKIKDNLEFGGSPLEKLLKEGSKPENKEESEEDENEEAETEDEDDEENW